MAQDERGGTGRDASGGGRRQGDRRKRSEAYEGPERRKGERRSGKDRRARPRDAGGTEEA